MSAIIKALAGGVAIAALAGAAPAAAQYYPGTGYGGIGQVLGQVLGGTGYGYNNGYNNGYGYNGYGANSQVAVSQCVGAVQQRLAVGYGNNSYGYGNNAYGYNGYGGNAYGYNGANGGGRVLGISRVEPRSGGGLTVRGVATSGRYAGAAYGYGNQPPVDLTFRCRTDYRGAVYSVDLDRAQSNYGSYTPYNASPYGNDYSQYGYRRY